MKILDLFSGAGIGADGYRQAFPDAEITCVDIMPQPNNPYNFIQADAMTFPLDGYDFIHASPPCQAHTTMSNVDRGKGGKADSHVSLIAGIRERLESTGVPYVIENVAGATRHMRNPVVLRGGFFGLQVERPRLYESNFPIAKIPFVKVSLPIGVYGTRPDGQWLGRNKKTGKKYPVRRAASLQQGKDAMGVTRDVTWRELAESIPPAHTNYIGEQLKIHLATTSKVAYAL